MFVAGAALGASLRREVGNMQSVGSTCDAEHEQQPVETVSAVMTSPARPMKRFCPYSSEIDLCSTFAGLGSPRTSASRRRRTELSELDSAAQRTRSPATPRLTICELPDGADEPAAPPPPDFASTSSPSSRSPEIDSEVSAAASGSWKRKAPWQRVNVPVYALSTVDAFGHSNMNIATFVTAISVDPKMYAVSVYHGTKTLENARVNGRILLQTLDADQHYKLVNLLGKQSGKDLDKMAQLAGMTEERAGIAYLRDALAVVELKVKQWVEAGDHELAVCDVVGWENFNDGRSLDMDDLRRHKLVRI